MWLMTIVLAPKADDFGEARFFLVEEFLHPNLNFKNRLVF